MACLGVWVWGFIKLTGLWAHNSPLNGVSSQHARGPACLSPYLLSCFSPVTYPIYLHSPSLSLTCPIEFSTGLLAEGRISAPERETQARD